MSTYKSNEPQKQPKTIDFKGNRYKLTTPFRWVDEAAGISEGPTYRMVGDKEMNRYFPDAAYLYANQPLSFMHRIRLG